MIIYASSFLAVPLPQEFRPEFRQVLAQLKQFNFGLKTVQPATPHITLYFLGQRSDEQLQDIADKIRPLLDEVSGTKLKVSGLKHFNYLTPKVIYFGVARPRQFDMFAESVANIFRDDHPSEKRAFEPHLTLARLPKRDIRERYLVKRSEVEGVLNRVVWNFPITELVLYGSLDPAGTRRHQRIITLPVL